MNLNDTQKNAVETIDINVCVNASAGTGKTTILANRYIYILKNGKFEGNDEIDSVVAITFTKKAASEMKSRIFNMLSKNAEHDVSFKKYISNFENANISTIHSFCHSVINSYVQYLDIDPKFKILSDVGDKLIIDNCINDVLKTSLYNKEVKESIINLSYPYTNLHENLKKIYFDMRNKGIEPGILNELFENAVKEYSDFEINLHDVHENLVKIYESARKNSIIYKKWDNDILHIIECKSSVDEECLNSLYFFKNLLSSSKAKSDLISQTIDTINILLLVFDKRGKEIINFFSCLLQKIDEKYSYEKSNRNLVDNDDLLILTRNLLRNKHIADELRKKYRYVMLDEYQDTNAIQQEIFYTICSENDGALLNRNNLFVVGDPKQSIYKFRGSDLNVFYDTLNDIEKSGGWKINLSENYRTSIPLVHCLNNLFTNIINGFEKIVPFSKCKEGEFICVETENDNSDEDSDNTEIEANAVSRIVNYLISKKNASLKEISILFRASTNIDKFEDAFIKNSIPYINTIKKDFMTDRPVKLIINALRYINDKSDINSLLCIIRSELSTADDREIDQYLYHLNRSEDQDSHISDEIKRILYHMDYLSSMKNKHRITKIIDEILRVFMFIDIFSSKKYSKRYIDSIESFIKFIDENSFFDKYNLSRFLERIDYIIGNDSIYNDFLSDKYNDNKVSLMTIHKSKGLEFDYVILAQSNTKSRASGDKITIDKDLGLGMDVNNLSVVKDKIAVKRFEEDLEEDKRIFYVALTRAKKGFYFLRPNGSKVKDNSFLSMLVDNSSDIKTMNINDFCDLDQIPHKEDLHHNVVLPSSRKNIRRPVTVNASQYMKFMSDPTLFKLNILTKILDDNKFISTDIDYQEYSGSKFGTEVHSLMKEIINNSDFNLAGYKPKVLKAINIIKSNLNQEFNSKSNSVITYKSEEAFAVEFQGDILHGVIDLIISDGIEAKLIDYKTNAVGSIEELVSLYRHQLDFYQFAYSSKTEQSIKTAIWFTNFERSYTIDDYNEDEVKSNISSLLEVLHMSSNELIDNLKSCKDAKKIFCDYILKRDVTKL